MKIITIIALLVFFGCSKPKGVPIDKCFVACPVIEDLKIEDCVGLKILEYNDNSFAVYSRGQIDIIHKDLMRYLLRLSKEFPCPK
jgi:hypothetical protein